MSQQNFVLFCFTEVIICRCIYEICVFKREAIFTSAVSTMAVLEISCIVGNVFFLIRALCLTKEEKNETNENVVDAFAKNHKKRTSANMTFLLRATVGLNMIVQQ